MKKICFTQHIKLLIYHRTQKLCIHQENSFQWHVLRGLDQVPNGYWNDIKNQRKYFDWIANELHITSPELWYKIKWADIVKRGGSALLKQYNGSLAKALANVYADIPWLAWKFDRVPAGYWDNREHQIKYIEWLETELKVQSLDDWYNINYKEVIAKGGSGLLHRFNNSLAQALISIYPQHNWQLWRFDKVPKHFWKDEKNVRQFLSWMAEQYNITKLDDWLSIPFGTSKLEWIKTLHGGLIPLLLKYFPGYNWSHAKVPKTKTQSFLLNIVESLFPASSYTVLSDYVHPSLFYPNTNREMELDIFIPELSLAFEYQGQQHYHFHPFFGDPKLQQQKDQQKRDACSQAGITLIEIPYWWDRKHNSVLATLHQYAPNKIGHLPYTAQQLSKWKTIPSHPSPSHLKKVSKPLVASAGPSFRLSVSKHSGGHAKCRGCLKSMTQKNLLRIEVRGTFTPVSHKDPIPVKFFVCPSVECVQRAEQRYAAKKGTGVYFPPFENQIGVTPQLRTALETNKKEFHNEGDIKLESASWIDVNR